jgi:hypothetical protein
VSISKSDLSITLSALNQRPIAYYPIYKQMMGTTYGGVILSQIMFWTSQYDEVWKRDSDIIKETQVTQSEMKAAKRALKKLPFLSIVRKGIPAITHYKVDHTRLVEHIVSTKNETPNKMGVKRPTVSELDDCVNTKTTLKTTLNTFSKEKDNALASAKASISGKSFEQKRVLRKIKRIVKKKKASPAIILGNTPRKPIKKQKRYNDHLAVHKKPKPKYTYTRIDFQCYIQLKTAGATKHDETKQPYFDTMDAVHALFDPKCKMPYRNTQLSDHPEIKDKKWTIEEVIEAFEYHLNYNNGKAIKNISQFILFKPFKTGSKPWSPLLSSFLDMNKKNPSNKLTENGNKLRQAFSRNKQTDLIKQIELRTMNKIGNEIAEMSKDYKFVRDVTGCEYGGLYDYFVKFYLPEKMNNSDFKLGYMNGEIFIPEFIEELLKRNTIVKARN